jgi:hypothetical protein
MQELHTSQAAGLREQLLASQQKELQAVLELHQREEQRLVQAWQERVRAARGRAAGTLLERAGYAATAASAWRDDTIQRPPPQVLQFEESLSVQVDALRAQQAAAQERLLAQLAARRPQRPKPSGEYLHQRRLQERAARLGEFSLAHQAQQAADAMYGAGGRRRCVLASCLAEWR